MQRFQQRLIWIVLIVPFAAALVIGLVVGVAGDVIGHTLVGMLGVAMGGVAAGVTAKRFLAHANGDKEVLYGLGATSAIGVVAIGYVYLFYLDHDMLTIGTLPRIYEQTSIFMEFLVAQYAGIQWAQRFFPRVKDEVGSRE